MDIQGDNDPWDNTVAEGDGPTCLDRLDYLAEREVVDAAGDDGNNPNSFDRKGSSYNAGKDRAGRQAEDRDGESTGALGQLQRNISMIDPNKDFRELTLNQMLLGEMLGRPGLVLVFLFLVLFVSVGSLSLPRFLGRCGRRLRCWLRRS